MALFNDRGGPGAWRARWKVRWRVVATWRLCPATVRVGGPCAPRASRLAAALLVAAALAGCAEASVDPTPEKLDGTSSREFEPEDIDAGRGRERRGEGVLRRRGSMVIDRTCLLKCRFGQEPCRSRQEAPARSAPAAAYSSGAAGAPAGSPGGPETSTSVVQSGSWTACLRLHVTRLRKGQGSTLNWPAGRLRLQRNADPFLP